MNFGLTANVIAKIQNILKNHPEIKRAQIFGSRALGSYRQNSDIDLALWGDIDELSLATIYAELDELPLPYKFDLVIYGEITHPPLREHIDRFGQDIFVK